eukprot:GHVP01026607.1.p1 GENE.GHVP01026607.1~~GHVP01026607.1.p1  ORF type:complete len:464 (+),score=88.68 GHVP01026607.1:1173-2564(+)
MEMLLWLLVCNSFALAIQDTDIPRGGQSPLRTYHMKRGDRTLSAFDETRSEEEKRYYAWDHGTGMNSVRNDFVNNLKAANDQNLVQFSENFWDTIEKCYKILNKDGGTTKHQVLAPIYLKQNNEGFRLSIACDQTSEAYIMKDNIWSTFRPQVQINCEEYSDECKWANYQASRDGIEGLSTALLSPFETAITKKSMQIIKQGNKRYSLVWAEIEHAPKLQVTIKDAADNKATFLKSGRNQVLKKYQEPPFISLRETQYLLEEMTSTCWEIESKILNQKFSKEGDYIIDIKKGHKLLEESFKQIRQMLADETNRKEQTNGGNPKNSRATKLVQKCTESALEASTFLRNKIFKEHPKKMPTVKSIETFYASEITTAIDTKSPMLRMKGKISMPQSRDLEYDSAICELTGGVFTGGKKEQNLRFVYGETAKITSGPFSSGKGFVCVMEKREPEVEIIENKKDSVED